MNLYDKIIASGLYAFQDEQDSLNINNVIQFLKLLGLKLSRNDSKLVELKDKVYFQNFQFYLKDDILIDDINYLVDPSFVVIFQYIKENSKINDQSQKSKVISPKKA